MGELPPGAVRAVRAGERWYALVNVDGQLHAIDNNCPHNGGPLAQGTLDPDKGCVTCPWHAWTWDVRTGQAISPPVSYRTPTYAVRVEGSDLLVSRYPQ